jgi:lipoprotein-releasing system permease protein
MNNKTDWIFFVAGRFGNADTKGRSALTSILSSLGIAFGVIALIVILSVMNGFQMGYIESILEVSSAHIRVSGSPETMEKIRALPEVRSLSVFIETQSIMQGRFGSQQGVLLRAVDPDIITTDKGFASSAKIIEGSFDLSKPNSVVLGYELARMLSVSVGDTVSLVAVSGGSSTDLFPENANLNVVGLFKTGYYAIDNSFSFVSRKDNPLFHDQSGEVLAGVKLRDLDRDSAFLSILASKFPDVKAESWRTYNRAFFGALRVEKNMLLFLVVLIFVVVTVNIHNSMRRSVYERREEISVLTALGAPPRRVQFIFISNGLLIGLSGGIIGLLAGLLLAVRINSLFLIAEDIVNGLNGFLSALFMTEPGQTFTLFSPEFFYMDQIPVRIQFSETLFIFLFGVLSAAIAAWIASRSITRLKPAEVLRYE